MKQKLIFVCIFLILTHVLNAQFNNIPQSPNKLNSNGNNDGQWTILFDKDWKLTNDTSQADYFRIINYKDGKPDGIVTDYYITGEKQGECHLIAENPDIYEGEMIVYYKNGKIKEKNIFKNELLNGKTTSYYEDGTIKSEDIYKNGTLDGFSKEYYSNGQLEAQGNYKNDERDGYWVFFWEDGKRKQESNFTKDSLDGLSKFYYQNGNLMQEIVLINHIPEGITRVFYEDGKLMEERKYLYGKITDTLVSYYQNGNKKSVVLYKDDKRNGFYIDYYENGKAQTVGNYIDDKPIGKHIFYYENGNKRAEGNFIEDKFNEKEKSGTFVMVMDNGVSLRIVNDFTGTEDLFARFSNRENAIMGERDTIKNTMMDGLWYFWNESGSQRLSTFIGGVELDWKNLYILYNNLKEANVPFPLFGKGSKIIGNFTLQKIAERLLFHSEAAFGSTDTNYIYSLIELGLINEMIGRFKDAIQYYISAWSIMKKNYVDLESGSQIKVAKIDGKFVSYMGEEGEIFNKYVGLLMKITDLEIYFGNYAIAEQLMKRAVQIFVIVYGTNYSGLTQIFGKLANLKTIQGRFQESEKIYSGVSFEGGGKEGQILNANFLEGYANLNYIEGKYAKADSLYQIIEKIYKGYYSNSDLVYAKFLENRSDLLLQMKKFKEAKNNYTDILEIYKNALSEEHPSVGRILYKTAITYQAQNNREEADKCYQEAINTLETTYNYPELIKCLISMVEFYISIGEEKKAESYLIEASEKIMVIVINNFNFYSEKEKAEFWLTFNNFYNLYLNYSIRNANRNSDLINKAFNYILITKAFILNSTKSLFDCVKDSGDSLLITKYERWKQLKEYCVYLQRNPIYKDKNEIKLKELYNLVNDDEKELSILSQKYCNNTVSFRLNFSDIANKLYPDEAAIEIVRYTNQNKTEKDSVCYAVFIVSKNTINQPELIVLENGNDLEDKFKVQYDLLAHLKKDDFYNIDTLNSELSELYIQYWQKIQVRLDYLGNIKKVYLSVDGVYNLINLNSLVNPSTNSFLIDDIDINLITSTRDIIKRLKSEVKFADNSAELFGDPTYNLELQKRESLVASLERSIPNERTNNISNDIDSVIRLGIKPLPNTRLEINLIDSILKKHNWITQKHLDSLSLEDAVKRVQSPRVLHLATHGKFLKDEEIIRDNNSFGLESHYYIENPLLRSFLLFAGSERALIKDTSSYNLKVDDGILTSYEAMNLNLENTDMVVLSACETGLGEIRNGEGVYGLQRAFFVAGAKTLIMSLWTVSDEATQKMMVKFYSKWVSGKDKHVAFKEAQQEIKLEYKYPYYWGAFVMVGE